MGGLCLQSSLGLLYGADQGPGAVLYSNYSCRILLVLLACLYRD
eukprot:COSAG05_NODE_24269_length_252_cov_1.313725_1_plen_43_part_10